VRGTCNLCCVTVTTWQCHRKQTTDNETSTLTTQRAQVQEPNFLCGIFNLKFLSLRQVFGSQSWYWESYSSFFLFYLQHPRENRYQRRHTTPPPPRCTSHGSHHRRIPYWASFLAIALHIGHEIAVPTIPRKSIYVTILWRWERWRDS